MKISSIKYIVIGIITGFSNGLFGSGGGTLLVLCLEKFIGIEAHKAHATSIAIVLPLSILSAFIYMGSGETNWKIVMCVSIGGVVGGIIGALILTKFSKNMLHKAFGVFMVFAAIKMIF